MTKIKTIVASLVAAATVSAVGLSASAVEYANPPFDFYIGRYSGKWSSAAIKQDSTNLAEVKTNGGDVSFETPMYVTTYSRNTLSNAYRETNTGKLSSNDSKVILYYEKSQNKDSTHYLRGESGDYTLTAKGYWNP